VFDDGCGTEYALQRQSRKRDATNCQNNFLWLHCKSCLHEHS